MHRIFQDAFAAQAMANLKKHSIDFSASQYSSILLKLTFVCLELTAPPLNVLKYNLISFCSICSVMLHDEKWSRTLLLMFCFLRGIEGSTPMAQFVEVYVFWPVSGTRLRVLTIMKKLTILYIFAWLLSPHINVIVGLRNTSGITLSDTLTINWKRALNAKCLRLFSDGTFCPHYPLRVFQKWDDNWAERKR